MKNAGSELKMVTGKEGGQQMTVTDYEHSVFQNGRENKCGNFESSVTASAEPAAQGSRAMHASTGTLICGNLR